MSPRGPVVHTEADTQNHPMRDLSIKSESVSLAIRDFGGVGRPILLVHGLGRTLIDWSVIAPLLTSVGRIVAFDLRGHGKSGDGPWSWDAAISDVDAVVSALKLEMATVVGHSLGGMLAVMWAKAYPRCSGSQPRRSWSARDNSVLGHQPRRRRASSG